MLSKSQAKLFFLGGTLLCTLIFGGLTLDTIRQNPRRSNEPSMTPLVVQGRELWTKNNCMGCHTIMGEGAYYAPELTLVVERRGKGWIREFLKDPAVFFPGRRQMVKYGFSDEQIDALIAYLEWVGRIDTNGFPAEPPLKKALAASLSQGSPAGGAAKVAAIEAAPEYFRTVCAGCHAVGGQGGRVGPALDGVATRYAAAELDAWLRDPQKIKAGTTMPKLPLSDQLRGELVTWLGTLN